MASARRESFFAIQHHHQHPREIAQRLSITIPHNGGQATAMRYLHFQALQLLREGLVHQDDKKLERAIYAWSYRLGQETNMDKIRLLFHNFFNIPHTLRLSPSFLAARLAQYKHPDGLWLLLGSLSVRGQVTESVAREILTLLQSKLSKPDHVRGIRQLLEKLHVFKRHQVVWSALDSDTQKHPTLVAFAPSKS